MQYQINKEAAKTRSTQETLTDQSAAKSTDINVIVKQFRIAGTAPGPAVEPMYGDFSELPGDLREMIETSRTIKERRRQLPPELREMPIEELLTLTPEQVSEKLKKPEPPAPPTPPADKPDGGTK